MTDHFLFSINVVVPLFAVLFLGFVLKKIGFLSDDFVATGNKVVFYIALPASLFLNVYSAEISELLDLRFAVFAVAASLVAFVLIWLLASFFIKDKPALGAFTQGAFRGNFAFLGMPLLISIAGEAGEARVALIMAFVLPVYNICTVLLLAACSDNSKKPDAKDIVLTIIKNPFVIVIIIAFGLQLLGINLPLAVTQTIYYPANMATALALICIGASMSFHGFDVKFKYAFAASLVKVILLPIIFVTAGYLLGFRDYDIAAILILGGVPSAVAGYAMVVQMGGDKYIAGTIIAISTFLSAFSLTVFIYILRATGLM